MLHNWRTGVVQIHAGTDSIKNMPTTVRIGNAVFILHKDWQ